jgi:hypothetical protein
LAATKTIKDLKNIINGGLEKTIQCRNTAIKSGPVMMAKKRTYFRHESAFLWFIIALR